VIVVGGVYRERCVDQNIDAIFGSGGRSATALASTGTPVELHTFVPEDQRQIISDALEPAGITIVSTVSPELLQFRYLHSLSKPSISPWPVPSAFHEVQANGQNALVFGFLEGGATVTASRAVVDPQGAPPSIVLGRVNAASKALILNAQELQASTKGELEEVGAAALSAEFALKVIVVKDGPIGARVYENGILTGRVPPYRTSRVYKIGSGDMFSAGFFYAWIQLGMSPLAAADYASRSAARYCETRSPRLLAPENLTDMTPLVGSPCGSVYIASPFFTLGDLWLVEEAADALARVGTRPFSPFHEIGVGPDQKVALADLEALKKSSAVLAIVSGADPGTLFEVGFATSIGIPVVALAQNVSPSDGTMLAGTGALLTNDFATAVYFASWATRR
jgi:hypothetical protein